MTIINPDSTKTNTSRVKIILRSEIENAQKNTNSNRAASKFLGVSYLTYRKYAKLYGLFEGHLNQTGIGVDKGFSKKPNNLPLRDILDNKHTNYSPAKLKNRLIARNKIVEVCSVCGFDEKRITDNKVPLILTFSDGNTRNYNLSNLVLLCYNCSFLTSGAPSVVNKKDIGKSFTNPENIPNSKKVPDITMPDHIDKDEDDEKELFYNNNSLILTPEERRALLEED